jgi:hypothetical protein
MKSWLVLLAGLIVNFAFAQADSASVPAPSVSVGDRWVYAVVGPTSRGTQTAEVTKADASGITVLRGATEVRYTAPWTMAQTNVGGRTFSYNPALVTMPFPLVAGTAQRYRIEITDSGGGAPRTDEVEVIVAGWEDLVVPAGKFRALRVVRKELNGIGTASERRSEGVSWYVPEVRWYAQVEVKDLARGTSTLFQLESFKVR